MSVADTADMAFCCAMTDEELEVHRETIITEGVEGITSVSVDGMSVNVGSAKDRLDLLDRIERRTSGRRAHCLPIGMVKVVSRGLQ